MLHALRAKANEYCSERAFPKAGRIYPSTLLFLSLIFTATTKNRSDGTSRLKYESCKGMQVQNGTQGKGSSSYFICGVSFFT